MSVDKATKLLDRIIDEGEVIKGGELSWQKSARWKVFCIDVISKNITMEEADRFSKILDYNPPPRPLPKGIGPISAFDEEGYVIGEQEENYKKDMTIKLEFLYALKDNIEKYPEVWVNKISFSEIASGEKKDLSSVDIIANICGRFGSVESQLKHRHSNRQTLEINDEYDVQDLFHALLKIFFDDIRPEEWTPSYAGSSNRMDFLLKKEKIVIEIKHTNKKNIDKQIGEQVTIDIAHYKKHFDCNTLICFIYDQEKLLQNPSGLIKDLTIEENDFEVKVLITH